ncbi:MAG: hypothetical protein NC912_06430 [Candidatus Omnitrophica bacterium]|nr:hypothetical protein [Candidatus Omnitrophota bacterium]
MEKSLIDKYKSAIDSENTAYLFYNYIAKNSKNRTVKNFLQLYREAKLHQRLLRIILKDSTGKDYKPSIDICKDKGIFPEDPVCVNNGFKIALRDILIDRVILFCYNSY